MKKEIVLLRQSDAEVLRDVCKKVNGDRGGGRKNYHREEATGKAGGPLQLLVITTPPNGGSGAAIGELIVINSDGSWQSTGTQKAVVCPKLR